jgi:hypothetical protein
MNFIKIAIIGAILFLLLMTCLMLMGCATCDSNQLHLPPGYQLVQDSGQKYRVKCPNGYLTESEWMTDDGAIGYAISYDEFYKKSH